MIALLTDSRYLNPENPNWYVQNILDDDRHLMEGLAKHGIRTVRVNWADADFDWTQVQAAVFRTTWDYFEKFDQFRSWLEKVQGRFPLHNSAELVRWNWDKHYLKDLERLGIRIPPTRVFEVGESVRLQELLDEFQCAGGIVKPTVSGAALHTYRFSRMEFETVEKLANSLLRSRAMIFQPFQNSVVERGELSLIVIDGNVTHAVKKVAKPGDFRVQDDHGGKAFSHEASIEEILFAEKAVRACPTLPVYARVDIIQDNEGKLAVMELEVIEPELFLRFSPKAAHILADVLAERLT